MGDNSEREPAITVMIRHANLRLWREFKVECARRDVTSGQLLNQILRERYEKDTMILATG